MKPRVRAGAGLLLLAAVAAAPLRAQTGDPRQDGWVRDRAGLLTSAQEAALERRMEAYKRQTGHDVVLLTVASLEGAPIERLALETAREWKLGRVGVNDGALLLVAQAERQMRIEVGRGLEGELTDSISGRIIRDVIVPRFRAGEFAAGLEQGVLAIHAATGGEGLPLPPEPRARQGADGPLAFPLVIVLLLVIVIAVANRRRGRRGGIGGGWIPPAVFMGTGRRGGLGGAGLGGGLGGGGSRGGGFSGFGGGGGFSGGGASGRW